MRHSIKDGVYYAVMTGGAESYFAAFAISLHASTSLVGLLASLPPLLASSMQLLSAWIGRKTGRRKIIIVAGALLQAFCLIPLAALPRFFPDHATLFLIPIVFLYLCGPNLGSPQWNSLVGDMLRESRRGRFFAERTRLSSFASLAAIVVAGAILDAADRFGDAYWGFVVIFSVTAAARCMSAWHLNEMHEPSARVAALQMPTDLSLWRRIRHSRLLRFSLFFAAMQFAVAISGPYFTLYLLRDLGLSYLEFMTITVASVCVQLLTLNRWGRLSDLFGNRLMLITTGSMITLLPSLWLVSRDSLWLLVVQMLSGLAWAGFSLSATAFVFDLTPPDRRATLIAGHNVLAAVAVFLGASVGAFLASQMPRSVEVLGFQFQLFTPLYGVFVASCLTRIMVALAFLPMLREVRRVRPMSPTGLIFRVTRMHPVSGLIYDIVGGSRRRRKRRNDGQGELGDDQDQDDPTA